MSDLSEAAVLIVGAGVSGLSCARALTESGRTVRLLERAHGVGGRCATRRLEGQPIDHGPAFLHGRDPAFLAALDAVPATPRPGWPSVVSGAGQPCQPEAFAPGERRLAFAEGVAAFPRHLASGLDIGLEIDVSAVAPDGARVKVWTAPGELLRAEVVVLAVAAEQALKLLDAIPFPPPDVASARAILGFSRSQACLALLALYPDSAPRPDWQVCYPEGSRVLQLVAHDSSKRPAPARLALMLQARPSWSRTHLEDPEWPEALLDEAARLFGPWAAKPSATHAHRWRYARSDRAAELAGPLLLTWPGGGRLGVCGERFAPGGGVEAAWRSGRSMAERLLGRGTGP
jgi:predicted NAD/FAD-dependent oxidoreductase